MTMAFSTRAVGAISRRAPQLALLAAATMMAACGGGGGGGTAEPVNPLKVDESFGTGGIAPLVSSDFGGSVNWVKSLADGKLLIAGTRQLESAVVPDDGNGVFSKRPKTSLFLKRLLENGQPDPSFGNNGITEFSILGSDSMEDVMVLPDGSILVASKAWEPCKMPIFVGGEVCSIDGRQALSYLALARFSANGSLDTAWADKGITRLEKQFSYWPRLAYQASGNKILVLATNSFPRGYLFGWNLARYLSDGSLDTGFGKDGVISSRCETDGLKVDVGGGTIWVAGALQAVSYDVPDPSLGVCVERFTSDGETDPVMPNPVKTALGANTQITASRVLSDGSYMLGGGYSSDKEAGAYVIKYQSSGSLNASYGSAGIAHAPLKLDNFEQMPSVVNFTADGSALAANFGQQWDTESVKPNIWVGLTAAGLRDSRLGVDGVLRDASVANMSSRWLSAVDSKGRWLMVTRHAEKTFSESSTQFLLSRLQGLN